MKKFWKKVKAVWGRVTSWIPEDVTRWINNEWFMLRDFCECHAGRALAVYVLGGLTFSWVLWLGKATIQFVLRLVGAILAVALLVGWMQVSPAYAGPDDYWSAGGQVAPTYAVQIGGKDKNNKLRKVAVDENGQVIMSDEAPAPKATVTSTPTYTPSSTWTNTKTYTNTPVYTSTKTHTPTPTLTEGTSTPGTGTPTYTHTYTYTPTHTYTNTNTHTYTHTPTPTATHTNTVTRVPWPMYLVPTAIPTDTPTWNATTTPTQPPTSTPTATNTPDMYRSDVRYIRFSDYPTPLSNLVIPAASPTPIVFAATTPGYHHKIEVCAQNIGAAVGVLTAGGMTYNFSPYDPRTLFLFTPANGAITIDTSYVAGVTIRLNLMHAIVRDGQ